MQLVNRDHLFKKMQLVKRHRLLEKATCLKRPPVRKSNLSKEIACYRIPPATQDH